MTARTPLQRALWAAVLAFAESLPMKGNGAAGRTAGEFTDNGDGNHTVTSTVTISQDDGSTRTYRITVLVEESRDDHDGEWGPGGARDGDDPQARVVVNGEHFLIGGLPTFGGRGFGGHQFNIAFDDGRRVTTRNLMHQGAVPPKWRHRFPDNARFEGGGPR